MRPAVGGRVRPRFWPSMTTWTKWHRWRHWIITDGQRESIRCNMNWQIQPPSVGTELSHRLAHGCRNEKFKKMEMSTSVTLWVNFLVEKILTRLQWIFSPKKRPTSLTPWKALSDRLRFVICPHRQVSAGGPWRHRWWGRGSDAPVNNKSEQTNVCAWERESNSFLSLQVKVNYALPVAAANEWPFQ